MRVNSSARSMLAASRAEGVMVPALPTPAARRLDSPEVSVWAKMLPLRAPSAFGLEKVAIGRRYSRRSSPLVKAAMT
jgi:hypothetical protein